MGLARLVSVPEVSCYAFGIDSFFQCQAQPREIPSYEKNNCCNSVVTFRERAGTHPTRMLNPRSPAKSLKTSWRKQSAPAPVSLC